MLMISKIKFANANQLPFLAVSGGHGWTNDISKVRGGVQINMRRMNSISLSEDKKTATVGGGTLQEEIVKELASKNRLAGTSSLSPRIFLEACADISLLQ